MRGPSNRPHSPPTRRLKADPWSTPKIEAFTSMGAVTSRDGRKSRDSGRHRRLTFIVTVAIVLCLIAAAFIERETVHEIGFGPLKVTFNEPQPGHAPSSAAAPSTPVAPVGTSALPTRPSIAPASVAPGPDACADSRKAVADVIHALNDLINSLHIRDAGTDHAIATYVNEVGWKKGSQEFTDAMTELSTATSELPFVDRGVMGRMNDGSGILLRLPDEVKSKQPGAGPDTRQLTDHRAHFTNDIQPNICSGKPIPNV